MPKSEFSFNKSSLVAVKLLCFHCCFNKLSFAPICGPGFIPFAIKSAPVIGKSGTSASTFKSLPCIVTSAEIKFLSIPSAIISSTFFWSSELFLFLTRKSNRTASLLLNLQRFAMSVVFPICANAIIGLPLSFTLFKSFVDNPITLLTPDLVI